MFLHPSSNVLLMLLPIVNDKYMYNLWNFLKGTILEYVLLKVYILHFRFINIIKIIIVTKNKLKDNIVQNTLNSLMVINYLYFALFGFCHFSFCEGKEKGKNLIQENPSGWNNTQESDHLIIVTISPFRKDLIVFL